MRDLTSRFYLPAASHCQLTMDSLTLDQSVRELQQHKDEWAALPIRAKMDLLMQTRTRLRHCAEAWVDASVRGKQIDPGSPWVGEEWMTGPWALAVAINAYLETLGALEHGHLPKLPTTKRADGRVVARVFPANIFDRMLLSGISAEVWMQPGVTEENLVESSALFYKQKHPRGKVALVLGAGNIASIAPLDVLYRLIAFGQVVMLKPSPVNDYLRAIVEDIFEPFMAAGYLRLASGGADVGDYLTHHSGVDEIHITGNARTHDAIFFGGHTAGLDKPTTCELGSVCPTIIVPGEWSAADIRFQAEHVATMKMHNAGFNCIASQVLVLAQSWPQRAEFLDALRSTLRALPPRVAYYPGSSERFGHALTAHPDAEAFANGIAMVSTNPNANDYCFKAEFFAAVLAETSLPGDDPAAFLRNAVTFCNQKLQGTLGGTILAHPRTMRQLGSDFDKAVAELRWGSVGINAWNAAAFLLPQATWGAYPGHTHADIQSGIGVVHNAFLFERPEKTVVRGSFYSFPRGFVHGDFSILPKPPWFVTNKTAHITSRRVAQFALQPDWWHLPGIFLSALRG